MVNSSLFSKDDASKLPGNSRNKEQSLLFKKSNHKASNSTIFSTLPKLNILGRSLNKSEIKNALNANLFKKENLNKFLSFKTFSGGLNDLKSDLEILKGKKILLRDNILNSQAQFDDKNLIIDVKNNDYSDVYKELLLTRRKLINNFSLDDKIRNAQKNHFKRKHQFLWNTTRVTE